MKAAMRFLVMPLYKPFDLIAVAVVIRCYAAYGIIPAVFALVVCVIVQTLIQTAVKKSS